MSDKPNNHGCLYAVLALLAFPFIVIYELAKKYR